MRKIALAIALAFAGDATAVIPDSGWYFNSSESGRGFNVEIQDNVLFVAGFMYDESGNPIWVFSGGPMSTDHTYVGDAFLTANGQPIGGAYKAPTLIPYGKASITWSETMNAIIVINGHTFNVSREQFGFDFTSTTQPLLGELSLVEGANVFFGDRIVMTGTQVINGTLWATGHKTGDPSRLAVGNFSPSLNLWTILLDANAYYDFFTFTFEGVNFVEGSDYTYLKGTNPSGSLPMVGYRTKSAQAAVGLDAPGSEKSATPVETLQSKAAVRTGVTLTEDQLDRLHASEAVLRSLQR